VVLAALLLAPPAAVAEPSPPPRWVSLEVPIARTAGLAGGAAAGWLLSEAFKSALAPAGCRWCDRSAAGEDTLNPLDRWGRGLAASEASGRASWARVSDVLLFGVVPAATAGGLFALSSAAGGGAAVWAEDLLVVAEAGALSALLNQAVKFAAGRERPFVHVLPAEEKPLTDQADDNNLSFYSGHASLAFALAVAAGTVAERRGYRHAWALWTTGLVLASTLPLLRMAADKHYLSDVAAGAALGSAVGFAAPFLLHPPVGGSPPVELAAGPGGLLLRGRF
jgi:membrane-associated phospholipid phosphatase